MGHDIERPVNRLRPGATTAEPNSILEALDQEPARWFRSERLSMAVVSVLMPLVLFVVLKPDWYYLQNGVDPFFYTGYVQNFRAALQVDGVRNYFISRWSIYLPQRIVLALVGNPKLAFLIVRWASASAIVAAFLALGRRLWRPVDAAALAAVVLLMPMTIRALFDDYADSVVLPLGVVMLVMLALYPEKWLVAVSAGAAMGAMLVANPFSLTIALCTLPFWLARVSGRRRLPLLLYATSGAALVVVGGLLFFRWRYGIANIYQPTIDFAPSAGRSDTLRSPRLLWLGYRLWIYIPLLLLLTYQVLRRRYRIEFEPAERFIMNVCALQYAFQIWFEFARHSDTLEVSYYWVYVLPATVLAFGVVVGKLARHANRWVLASFAVVVVALIAVVGSPTPELFDTWIIALLTTLGLAYLSGRFIVTRPWIAPVSLAGLILALQVGSPRPEPTLATEEPVPSSYERAYAGDRSIGVDSFESVTWFVDQMNTLPASIVDSAQFWFNEPNGSRMAGMYLGQVSGRWINPDWSTIRGKRSDALFYAASGDSVGAATPSTADSVAPFGPDLVSRIQQGLIPTWVIVGSPHDVDAVAAQAMALDHDLRVVLSAVSPNRARTNVRVLTTIQE
jgi:hypothetical protein